MSGLVCSFTGHREINEADMAPLQKRTEEVVELLIARGVKEFISGGAVGYDLMCAEIILNAKKYANIKLTLAVPYEGQGKRYGKENKALYERVEEGADEVICLSDFYYRGCMHARNRYMVDRSDFLVSYCVRAEGGSYYTRCYAKENKKHIIDILI